MTNKHKFLMMTFSAFIVVVIGLLGYNNANSKIITNIEPDISAEEWKAVVIEDFEKPLDWSLDSVPKKNTEPKKDPTPVLKLKYIQGGPSALRPERWTADKRGMEKKTCLGIHFKFRYPGYNSIHLLPPLEVSWDDPNKKVLTYDSRTGKEIQEKAIQLPGRVKAISVWFHGRGNDYNLECWIKDHIGEVHILKFGSLNFVGWRPLKAYIPKYVPQKMESYPMTRGLKIVRFVIRSTPDAKPVDVYMFFDQLKALTDTYEVSFDGQDLHKSFEQGTLAPEEK
ncbi:MAG: flagellar filament outer layer protein FlaA [Spirochaetota bacterium]|nr:flagellar filament outer layer protein FlaA [Spirochaetota bacterium]